MNGQIQPPVVPSATQGQLQSPNRDGEHLRLLSIFHYVAAGICGFFSCFGFIHIAMGLVFIIAPETFEGPEQPPPFFGWIFVAAGSVVVNTAVLGALCRTTDIVSIENMERAIEAHFGGDNGKRNARAARMAYERTTIREAAGRS